MAVPTETEIMAFLTEQLALWNAGEREAMTALYRRHAPDGLVIEYVGHPIGDGWAAYNHMWDNHGGKVTAEAQEILVNGNEGACFVRNTRVATGRFNPSIETYRFGDGTLQVRYFHRSDVE